ncbi:MAG: SDR family NAD(P)-dependent oxidoreductase, partial [Planctomycetales bacterium]
MSNGLTALVTGAGKQRVGNVVARDLAAAGYRVAIHYFTSQEPAEQTVAELREQGADVEAFHADLRNEPEVRDLTARVVDRFGSVDAVVCSAASWLRRPLEETGAEELRSEWETNTASV